MVSTRDHAISKHKSFKDSISCCLLSLYFFRWFCDVVFAHPLHQDFSLEELEKPFGNLMGTWWEHIGNKRKKNAPILPPCTPKLKRKNLRPLHVCWGFSLTIWGKIPKVFITIFNVFIHSKREWGSKEIKENYSSFLKGKKVVIKITKLFTNSKEKN